MFFLFYLKEMSANPTDAEYYNNVFEEEEEEEEEQTTEQETNPFKKIDLIKLAKENKKKGITKKISDSDDETETEEEQETTEETKTNIFTCMNDEYKQKQTYKKMTTGRENNEEILLCCSDVKQNLNNYFAIDEDEINERLNNNNILYEVIYGFRYIKPYIDLDMDDKFNDDEVYKTFKYILKTLQDKKLNFVVGGYTSIEKINKKLNDIEIKDIETTHKKLSLRIFAHKYAIDINKSLAFWVEYIGLNKELISKKIIDPSVYKSADKQQKLRLLQSNKTTEDNKGVKNYYIYNVDNEEYTQIEEGFKVEYLAATWTKDAEIFDSSKLTDNETLKKQLRGKTTTTATPTENKKETTTTENKRETTENKEEEEIKERTVFLNEEQLFKLLNLFECEFENVEQVISILCHSPYPKEVIERVAYKWYNQRKHSNGDQTKQYINTYYKYTENNRWFYAILNKYYTKQKITELDGWNEENEKQYNKYKYIKDNQLSKKQRDIKRELTEKRSEIKETFIGGLTDEDKKKYKNRKQFIKIFRDIQRITAPDNENISFYNNLFKDRNERYYLKVDEYLQRVSISEVNEICKNKKMNKTKLTTIDFNTYNFINKYDDVFELEEYKEKAREALESFKTGFCDSADYMYFIRWLSTKLNNPNKSLSRNIVCLLGSGSFKTTFIESFKDFIKFSKIDYSIASQNSFNEWAESSIVMVDEVPRNAKDVSNIQNFFKQNTSNQTITINKKHEHERTIKNCVNIIINSNFPNCGGFFDNQQGNEIFRRFKIIKKQEMKQEDINKLFTALDNKYILYNMYLIIKNEIKPLNNDEMRATSEYEQQYRSMVKNIEDNYKVLYKDEIEDCINKRNYLSISILYNKLKQHNVKTSIANERMILCQEEIISKNGNNWKVINKEKLFNRYLTEDEEEQEEDTSDNEPTYAKITN